MLKPFISTRIWTVTHWDLGITARQYGEVALPDARTE
jgi:hypothetical protein